MPAARLLQAGARVHPKRLRDGREAGEPRLWLPDREAPGLLVSRAIGDDLASTVGCIAQPSVRRWRLRPGDEYLVIASDGVWDMLPNEEVGRDWARIWKALDLAPGTCDAPVALCTPGCAATAHPM